MLDLHALQFTPQNEDWHEARGASIDDDGVWTRGTTEGTIATTDEDDTCDSETSHGVSVRTFT